MNNKQVNMEALYVAVLLATHSVEATK